MAKNRVTSVYDHLVLLEDRQYGKPQLDQSKMILHDFSLARTLQIWVELGSLATKCWLLYELIIVLLVFSSKSTQAQVSNSCHLYL